jgi:hypothetical protein
MTPCIPLKINWLFGGTCRLHLQGRRISEARKQHEAGNMQTLKMGWPYPPLWESQILHNIWLTAQPYLMVGGVRVRILLLLLLDDTVQGVRNQFARVRVFAVHCGQRGQCWCNRQEFSPWRRHNFILKFVFMEKVVVSVYFFVGWDLRPR